MSSSVDTKIVELKFNNSQFEQGVKQSLDSMKNLEKGLELKNGAKGMSDIEAKARGGLGMDKLAAGVQSVADKFKATSVIALTALTNITNKAVNAGLNLAKSLTIAPISQGLQEYETQLNAIQTVLANTQAAGTKLSDVNSAFAELNTYADKTIYNFTEMTRNIGTFTAAGVELKTATASIKGIANLAALSGSNSQQASTAMYQLSQALSAGRVSLQDWNSVVNAGMGGTVFQRALAQTAVQMGTLDDSAVKLSGKMKKVTIDGEAFRQSISAGPGKESWLTSDVLTKTLEQFTGDLTDAELAAQGFSKAQIKAIQDQAKTASEAATVVKTGTQLVDTLQEAVGSGWAQTWQTVIGDFEEAKKLWTGISDELGGIIQTMSDSRNNMLKEWKAEGGRDAVIEGLKNSWRALINLIKPIKEAFREIFPAASGKQLADISKAFRDFTKQLMPSYQTAENLKRTFRGLFAIFGIGWEIIKQTAKLFARLFSGLSGGSGSILEITGSLGDFFYSAYEALKSGDGLANVFQKIGDILIKPVEWIKKLAGALADLFSNTDFAVFDNIEGEFKPFETLGNLVTDIWANVLDKLGAVADFFAPLAGKISEAFQSLQKGVESGVGTIDWSAVLKVLGAALGGGVLAVIWKFIKKGGEAIEELKSWKATLMGPFDALTGTLETMQGTLKAATLLQIAAAVGILAASVVALSKVDEKGLKNALGAMAVLFVQLTAAMAVFQKINIKSGMTQLILLAAALRVLVLSVEALAELDYEQLKQGLIATGILLGAVVIAARAMPDGKKMISSSTGLVIMAGAIRILVGAVKDLGEMDYEQLKQGLIGVGAILGGLAIFTRLAAADKGGVLQGAGLLLMAYGIKILGEAIEQIGSLEWEQIGKGLVGMGGGLLIMAAALKLVPPSSILSAAAIFIAAQALSTIGDAVGQMGNLEWEQIGKGMTVLAGALILIGVALAAIPPSSILNAAAIFIVAQSLTTIGEALALMGAMEWETIVKGLVALGGALILIAGAMLVMSGALAGAAALTVVTLALSIFLPVLMQLGQMELSEIGLALGALAGAFVILGLAGLILTPVVPTLLGLGIAVGLLGAGMALAGLGVLAFSAGLTALGAAGAAAVAGITAIVTGLLGLMPEIAKLLGATLVALAEAIIAAAPAIVEALVVVLSALLDGIAKMAPKIGRTLLALLRTLLNILIAAVPMLVDAGGRIIIGFLRGIANKIPGIVKAGADVIIAFIRAIGEQGARIAEAGADTIIKFVNSLANTIRTRSGELRDAGKNLAVAIIDGITGGLASGIGRVIEGAKNLASSALNAAKNFLGIKSPSKEFAKLGKYSAQGYAKGLTGSRDQILAAYKTMSDLLSTARKAANEDIDQLNKKLAKQKANWRTSRAEIRKTEKALAQARAEYKKVGAAISLSKTFGDERTKLLALAKQLDRVGDKLEAANKKLEDAKKVRDDYNKSVGDQYSKLPDISGESKLTDYVSSLEKQIADTQIFTAQLSKLRELGLNDEVYKLLLSKGTEAIPFATQLLDGGQSAIDQINTLQGSLMDSAEKLGSNASTALYQAGVDAAQGIVDGLAKEEDKIQAQMDRIADRMVASIKKKLGIRSPSRVMKGIGNYTIEGLVEGLNDSTDVVKAAENVGLDAIDAMRKTLKQLDTSAMEGVDLNPSIRPVLDLSQVEKDARSIQGILAQAPLDVSPSADYAAQTNRAYRASDQARANAADQSAVSQVTYNQYLSSPEPLSQATIYRQSKNLLSQKKGALSKS